MGGALGYLLPYFLTGEPFPHLQTVWLRDLGLAVVVAVIFGGLPWLLGRTRLLERLFPAFGQVFTAMAQGHTPSSALNKIYGPFYQQSNFPPERRATLNDLISKKVMVGSKAGRSLMGCLNHPEKRAALIAELKSDMENYEAQIRQLLGEANYQALRTYEKTIPDRAMVDTLDSRAPGVSEEKKEQLIRALGAARAAHPWSTELSWRNQTGVPDIALVTKENIEIFAHEEEEFDRQFLQQARQILAPAQLAAFEKIQERRRKSQISQFKMGARLFGIKN
jgi:hypothetical protein